MTNVETLRFALIQLAKMFVQLMARVAKELFAPAAGTVLFAPVKKVYKEIRMSSVLIQMVG